MKDKVQCLICSKEFKILVKHLICKHNITPANYMKKFSNAKIESEEITNKRYESCKKYLKKNFGVENLMHVEYIKNKAEDNMRKTFKKRYGVEHPMKSEYIKQLYKKSLKNKYGVDCVMRVDEIKKKQRKSYNNTCLNKYGVKDTFSVYDIQKKARLNVIIKPNNIEFKINKIFKELKYVGNGKLWIELGNNKRKNPDFIVKNQNKIVELFGDYWHGEKKLGINPKLHCKQVIKKYKDVGYDCLIIWEKEIKHNFNNVIKKINNFINLTFPSETNTLNSFNKKDEDIVRPVLRNTEVIRNNYSPIYNNEVI